MDTNAINHLADSINALAGDVGKLVALLGLAYAAYKSYINGKRLDRHADKIDNLLLNAPPPGQPQAVAVAVEGKDKAD